MAVAPAGRRPDPDENRVRRCDRGAAVERKGQTPFLDVLGDQLVEAWLKDRDLAASQFFDLGGILVDADDVMAEIGPSDQVWRSGRNLRSLLK
jgi:hypothetical protein